MSAGENDGPGDPRASSELADESIRTEIKRVLQEEMVRILGRLEEQQESLRKKARLLGEAPEDAIRKLTADLETMMHKAREHFGVMIEFVDRK